MSDMTESIIDYLQTSPDFGSLHIGEMVPQNTEYPYIWLMRSGDEPFDSLCHPPTSNSSSLDVEIVSDDIAECREVTAEVKAFLRESALHSLQFTNEAGDDQTIHSFDVDDHDDNYIPRNIDSDENLHVGSLNVRVLLGELV